MALVALTDDLQKHLDQGRLALLLLDLTAVLNTVNYDLITYCFTDMGYRGLPCNGFPPFSMVEVRGWH